MRAWVAALFAATVALGGCGMFGGGKDKEAEPPTELTDIDTRLDIRRAWSVKVGGGSEHLRLGLVPATDGTRIFGASHKGRVVAVDAETGRRAWLIDTKLPFSAGPGYGEGLVVVCSSDGDVLAFEAADGNERWRAQLRGEVLATPAIARGRVLIRTVDGTLRSLSAADGAEEWVIEREVPRLTLRGNGPPVVLADLVISGFDNGKVAALSLQTGEPIWEISLAPPSGRTELERMVDVDSRVWIVGEDLFVSGYHGRTVSLASESGQILWSRDIDSYAGVGVDWNNVYVTQSDSAVLAVTRRGGASEWSQEGLKFRTATAPVPYGKSVVVGDFEGYVHWLDADSGEFVARERAGEAIVMPPLVVGELLVVFSEDGQLTAYRADFGSS